MTTNLNIDLTTRYCPVEYKGQQWVKLYYTPRLKTKMNGLNKSEEETLKKIRELATTNIGEAKKTAIEWINANKNRKALRMMFLKTIKGLHS